ncbi:hypothetical protein DRJ19_03730 [Candidatus Woesearchaeota archaeon]|nr:MAG: hypothetical protein DRJ19_03730 [Candidatus Woesearchaeota archaeon]
MDEYKLRYYGCVVILLVITCVGIGFQVKELFDKLGCDYECQLKEMCREYCEQQERNYDCYFSEKCNGTNLEGHFICLCFENKSLVDSFDIKYVLRSNKKCS